MRKDCGFAVKPETIDFKYQIRVTVSSSGVYPATPQLDRPSVVDMLIYLGL